MKNVQNAGRRGTACMVVVVAVACLGAGQDRPIALAPPRQPLPVKAELVAARNLVLIGQPVVVSAIIHNGTDQEISLDQASGQPAKIGSPSTRPARSSSSRPASRGLSAPPQGLTRDQVFGAKAGRALRVREVERDEVLAPKHRAVQPMPTALTLRPHGLVGARLDLSHYFYGLREPGTYELSWAPFEGLVEPATVRITIEPAKMVTISTDFGQIRLRLFYEDAPRHVANFLGLVEQGFYDKLTFHRVVKDLMILGGDPKGDGTGVRPDGMRLRAELNKRSHVAGALSMACIPGDPNSGSCQFFICLSREPSWDGTSTVFGECADAESLMTARRMAAVPTDRDGKPLEPLLIRRITTTVQPTDRSRKSQGTAGWR